MIRCGRVRSMAAILNIAGRRSRENASRGCRAAAVVAWALGAAGCPDGPVPSDATVATVDGFAAIALELGTGQTSWETLPPYGATVELIHGPQGGYHFWGRYRFNGFPPDVSVSFVVTPIEGGDAINDPTNRVHRLDQRGLVRTDSGWECAFPELVILTTIHAPSDVVGRRFRWQILMQNTATHQYATAEREITIVDNDP